MLNYLVIQDSNCIIHIYIFKETKSKNHDGDEEQKPPLMKTISKFKDSRPIKLIKQLSSMAEEHLDTFSKNFESNLKAETEKQINGKNQK